MSTIKETEILTPRKCLSERCELRSAYLRETLRAETLKKQLQRVTEQNEAYKKAVTTLLSNISDLLKPSNSALVLLKERLFPLPQVSSLYYFVSDGVINLLIITQEEDFETEMRIAESLTELFSVFSDLRFDFMIIPKYDLDIKEILPSMSKKLFSK